VSVPVDGPPPWPLPRLHVAAAAAPTVANQDDEQLRSEVATLVPETPGWTMPMAHIAAAERWGRTTAVPPPARRGLPPEFERGAYPEPTPNAAK